GPYWVEEQLFRTDVRTDPSTGVARAGIPLALAITLVNSNANCAPLTGAYVDIWHCDAKGIYSDEPTYNPGGGTGNVNTKGAKFLRGYQLTDSNGLVNFLTIYPGWYSSRTIHIHVRIRTYNGSTELTNYTTQIFFDDAINNVVMANSLYSRTTARDTTNATDSVYNGAQNKATMLAAVTTTASGYAAALTIDLAATVSTSNTPVVAANAILDSAGATPGLAPGAWVSLYGSNLATSTYQATSDDLVNGYLPTNLKNTTVTVDGNAAYLDYISPTQINMLVASDSKTGSVQVVVTNANGSYSTTAALQAFVPGLFVQGGYATAFRSSDGVLINGTGAAVAGYTTAAAAKAGDVLEIYGTGFGPTTPSVAPGLVFSDDGYPTSNAVTVTVGGVSAIVLYAGLIGAGLYQLNVAVPSGLTAGDNVIIASVGGYNSQVDALLKIAASV
ncbi:MAG TPA: IPT/TIG domain-containing protein, partial [Bryobacteraceae bacterium]